MSSSQPSSAPSASPSLSAADDDIGNLLKSVTVSSPTKGDSIKSSGLSGEYQLFAKGGSNFNPKHVNIVYFSDLLFRNSCCGFIGSRKQGFCLKNKRECNIASHATSKFNPIEKNFYICRTSTSDSAWCDFTTSSSNLKVINPDLDSLASTYQSLSAWKAIFANSNSIDMNENVQDVSRSIAFMTRPVTRSNLRTPAAKFRADSRSRTLFEDADENPIKSEELSVIKPESSISIEDRNEWNAILPASLTSFFENLVLDVENLCAADNKIKNSVPEFMSFVSRDLTDVVSSLAGLKQSIGTDHQGSYPDLWSAISEFDENLNGIDFKNLEELATGSSFELTVLNEKFQRNSEHWMSLGKNWLPLIQQHSTSISLLKSKIEQLVANVPDNPTSPSLDFLLQNPSKPATSINPISNSSSLQQDQHSSTIPATTLALIKSLEAKVHELEIKVASNSAHSSGPSSAPPHHSPSSHPVNSLGFTGVTYKQYYFANPFEVKTWMKDNMTHPSHGLFVDLVSFSEFFGRDSYTERGQTLNELYMTNKIGYQTMADAVVASSFSNVLPGAYARVPSSSTSSSSSTCDMASQKELPGLSSYDKWDGMDGRTGRRWWIIDETRKTEQQIDGWIRSQLQGPAQLLAKDLLMDSYSMSDALYTFISTSFADTRSSNKFSDEQCWVLTSSFVKRIFQELGYVRVMARDSVNISDPWSTSATFLFATLRAHVIMQEFMRLSIKDHPSISSEMVKFVCYAQPAQGASALLSRMSATEALQRSDQSNISKLEGRTKKLEAWKSESDKLLAKLKTKAGL
jgi:hypothetical protein